MRSISLAARIGSATFLALLLSLNGTRAASDIALAGGLNSLLEKPLDNAMASALKVDLPINLQDNAVLSTVENAALPGGPFQGRPLKPSLSDLSKPVAPGDYTIPMMAFCMQYSIHQGGGGMAYEMAPLQGSAAKAVSALIWRGYTVKHISPGQLQVASWAIQSGTPYHSMPPDLQQLIHGLIPEYVDSLNGDKIQQIEEKYDKFPLPRKPPLETVLTHLGAPGQLVLGALKIRGTLIGNTTNALKRNQELFAGQGTIAADPPRIRSEDGPWTVLVPGVAYERARIIEGNGGYNELQIRVLPRHVSYRELTVRSQGTKHLAQAQIVAVPLIIFVAEVAEGEALDVAAIRAGAGLIRLAAPMVKAQTLMMAMISSGDGGGNDSPGENKSYKENPDNSDHFTRSRAEGRTHWENNNDGSIWEKDRTGHGGSEWKRWASQNDWLRWLRGHGPDPQAIRGDGTIRK